MASLIFLFPTHSQVQSSEKKSGVGEKREDWLGGVGGRGLESLLGAGMLSVLLCRFHGCRCSSEMKFYKLNTLPLCCQHTDCE